MGHSIYSPPCYLDGGNASGQFINEKVNMCNENNNLALHFKYFAFIALSVVILVATERWSSSKEFTTYLSNAATMTSLFLGIVAILYSFISNDGIARSLGSISTVADEVRNVRHEIASFVDLTKDSTQAAASSNAQVREASASVSISIESLSATLQELSSQNMNLRELLGSLPTRFDQLDTKVGDVVKAIGEKPQQGQPPISTTAIPTPAVTAFLARAPLHYNLLVHACVLAAQNKKPLSITDFCKTIESDAPNSYQGFLTCMSAIQLCLRKVVEGQDKTFTISSIHPDLIVQSKPYFVKYVNETFSDRPAEQAKWMAKLQGVEEMFA